MRVLSVLAHPQKNEQKLEYPQFGKANHKFTHQMKHFVAI